MAKSIKLGADTYLDASGVVVDANGTTLASGAVEFSTQISRSTSITFRYTNFKGFYDPVSKLVTLFLYVTATSSTIGNNVICTIPRAYRPTATKYGVAILDENGTMQVHDGVVYANGTVAQSYPSSQAKKVAIYITYKL